MSAMGTEPATVTQPAAPKKSSRNASIEGLRGFAALLVVISHVNGIAVDRGFAPGWQKWVDTVLLNHLGTFGVCAFFCISGFLILQSLLKSKSLGEFAINRVKRIYPLFIAMQLVAFPIALVLESDLMPYRKQPTALIGHFFSNLFFIPGVFEGPLAQKNAWTLSYEAVFYVTSALIFLGLGLSKNGAVRVIATVVGIAAAVALLILRPYFWFFAVGTLTYWMFSMVKTAPSWLKIAPLGLVGMVAAYLLLPAAGRTGFTVSDAPLWVACLPLSFIFFATLVYEEGWLSSFLQQGWLQHLGAISYSLYLVHPFVLHPLRMVIGKLPASIGPYAFIVLGLGLSIWVAGLTFKWIEVELTRKLFPRKPAPPTSTT